MWRKLKDLGLEPATATSDSPPIYTMGDLQGTVDPLCHELVRRLRADQFMTRLFGSRIDYYEFLPAFDWRDFPVLKIIPGDRDIDYGVGNITESHDFPVEFIVTENADECMGVPYGYPTIQTLASRMHAFLNAQGTFRVLANSVSVGLARYSRPGRIARLPQAQQSNQGTRAIMNTRIPWLFTLMDVASTQKNYNVAAAGG